MKTWQHAANEWADAATNGLQWLKNIRDGISTPEEAIAALKSDIAHAQSEQPGQDAIDAARYRWLRQGQAITVKCKKSTIIFGPSPEKDYGNALDKEIDAKIGETK